MAEQPRRPGRPPLKGESDAPSADVHLKLPASMYDSVHKLARERRENVQDVIRRGLRRLLADETGGSI